MYAGTGDAGRAVANPTSLILSAGMLLDWHGARSGRQELREAWRLLEGAVATTVADPQTRTRDLGGTLGTDVFARAVIDRLHRTAPTLREETHA